MKHSCYVSSTVSMKLKIPLYVSRWHSNFNLFIYTTLTPSDCLCIGYFLAHVCKMAAGEFKVNFESCSISDQCCKYLVSGLHKCLDTHSSVTTLLTMNLSNNTITHCGVHHLSTLLKVSCIEYLDLGNDHFSEIDHDSNELGSLQGIYNIQFGIQCSYLYIPATSAHLL